MQNKPAGARPRPPRCTFREMSQAAQEPLRALLRDRPAVSANDFTLGLYAGHMAFLCPLCGHAAYPVTTLGRAYSKVREHIDQAHA